MKRKHPSAAPPSKVSQRIMRAMRPGETMYFRGGPKDDWLYDSIRRKLAQQGQTFSRAKAVVIDPVTCAGFPAIAVTCLTKMRGPLRVGRKTNQERMRIAMAEVEELHRVF